MLGQLLRIALDDPRFRRDALQLMSDPDALRQAPMSQLLGTDVHCRWMRMLLMYAYSTPYEETGDLSAQLAAPVLLHMTRARKWTRIVGGVYSYLQRILDRFGGTVHVNAAVRGVRRQRGEVIIEAPDGALLPFDRVVLAATPDQVLPLLTDATEAERRRFSAWRSRTIRTELHDDFSMYAPYGAQRFTEFDLFESPDGRGGGYNAWLNRLCDVDPAHPYGMAYNLEDRIDRGAVLQAQEHTVPCLTVDALRYRHEVTDENGSNQTFYAGAWLGDGLHEGATVSALAISHRLGGRTLR